MDLWMLDTMMDLWIFDHQMVPKPFMVRVHLYSARFFFLGCCST
jgi:hypothetical protein